MKKTHSRGSRRCSPAPHAQWQSLRHRHVSPKSTSETFSQEYTHRERGSRRPSSSSHRTSSSSAPPVATAYTKLGLHPSAASLTSSHASGALPTMATSPPTLLTTEESEAKDGKRRPPLRRPKSPLTKAYPGAGSAVQQQTPIYHQRPFEECATPVAPPRSVRHLVPPPPHRRRRVVYGSSSSSCVSTFSASRTDSIPSRSCSSSGSSGTCRTRRSWQRCVHQNRRCVRALASAAHAPAVFTASKASRGTSKRKWIEHCAISRGSYSDTSSSRSLSSGRTSSNCSTNRRKRISEAKEDTASFSSCSSTSVVSICVLTDVLPRDVYLHICSFLGEMDCCTLLEVSLRMHAAITSADSNVWRHICLSTWMWKQGFQTFIEQTRALEVLARHDEREVLALQQQMLLLREKSTVFGESDVSATCDCATVLMRRRQHERAQWMAAAEAKLGTGTPTLYRPNWARRLSCATTSASSTTQTNIRSNTDRERRSRRRRKLRSRLRHGSTMYSSSTTASTSRRSGNVDSAADRESAHGATRATTAKQQRHFPSMETSVISRSSPSRRNPREQHPRGDEDQSKVSHSVPSPTSSSSELPTDEATRNDEHHTQTCSPSQNLTDDPESRHPQGGSNAGEKDPSTTRRSTSSISFTQTLVDQHEREGADSLVALGSANLSLRRGEKETNPLSTRGSEADGRTTRRVCIRLPEETATECAQDNHAHSADTSVGAIRSRSSSRHRKRGRRSSSHRPLSPAHRHHHHRQHDGSSRRQRSKPPGSRYRRSHSVKRRKPARQRRRKSGRSRGPRSTGGGGGRHRSQQNRGSSRHHRSSNHHHHHHHHHNNTKATQSSRRRRRRQRNAAAQASRNGSRTSAYTSSHRGAAHTSGTGSNTFFYQTATYEAIKSTAPIHQVQHLAPSVALPPLGGRSTPAASAVAAVVSQNQKRAPLNPRQPCGNAANVHAMLDATPPAQPASLLNSGGSVAQMALREPQQVASASHQVALPGTCPREEGLYWWQLTPEARQHQLRRIQQRELQHQQRASPSHELSTRAVASLPDGDELADEAALREWDELEAPSFCSSSGTIDEEGTNTSRDEDREEVDSDPSAIYVTSGEENEREGGRKNAHHDHHHCCCCRLCRCSRMKLNNRSRSASESTASDSTVSAEVRRRHLHRQRNERRTKMSPPSTSLSHTHTSPPSLDDDDDDDESAYSEFGADAGKERWVRTGAPITVSFRYQRTRSSDVSHTYGEDDSDDAEEEIVVVPSRSAAVASEAGSKCVTSSDNRSDGSRGGGHMPSRVRRAGHLYLPSGISLSTSKSSSSRSAMRAERRVAKALAKRYAAIEEAMIITRSKSVLIHTLERQTHVHLPQLLAAAAAQRQRSLVMMSTRPTAAAAVQHGDPSRMSSTTAVHPLASELSETASVSATRAIILIGPGSGAATTLPAASPHSAAPAPHLPSSLENPFTTVTAATLAVPASPLHQLACISNFNAMTTSGGEPRSRLGSTVSRQEDARLPTHAPNTLSLVVHTGGTIDNFGTEARSHPQNLVGYEHTAVASMGSNVSAAALPSVPNSPVQLINEDEDEDEEQLAPVSWKFAFFMSRRESHRTKITLQDLLEGMWVVCFRSSGRTHPIRFMRQNQIIVYPPLPTEEEEQLRWHNPESSEAQGEAAHATPAATETRAASVSPPLPFHILQGGMQLVVHQFPPMKVMRRNASVPANAVKHVPPPSAVPISPASAPPLTPAMVAERRFAAEPQATLHKMHLCMMSFDRRDETTLEAMACDGITGGSAIAGRAADGEPRRAADGGMGGRTHTFFDSQYSSLVAPCATTDDVRRGIAERLGFPVVYIHEVLGETPARSSQEHLREDGAITRCGYSAVVSRDRKQPVFYGPLTQRELKEQQRREALVAPGGAGDVFNDWGWTIASQHVKIFSLDVTAPLYVERLQRVAYVELSGGRERNPKAF